MSRVNSVIELGMGPVKRLPVKLSTSNRVRLPMLSGIRPDKLEIWKLEKEIWEGTRNVDEVYEVESIEEFEF